MAGGPGWIGLDLGGRAPARRCELAVFREELHHVFKAETAIAALADTIEGQFTAIAQALDGIDVEVQEVCDLAGRQHRADLVDSH